MELAAAGEDQKLLRAVASALIGKAAMGDVPAIKELGDRLDGKPAQAIIGGEEDDPPVKITRIELVAATNDDSEDQASS